MPENQKDQSLYETNNLHLEQSQNDIVDNTSHRQIVRDSTIIGGASIINIAIGLFRSKVAALLLGPSGLGLIALLLNAVTTGAVVAGLGIFQPAVREIAEANGRNDAAAVANVRRAFFWITALLALLGAAIFWLLRDNIARDLLGNLGLARSLGWLALAVALTVIATSQMALLYGYRRIGDIAVVQVFSALLGTLTGVMVLAIWHEAGIICYIVAAPASAVLAGLWAMARLPRYGSARDGPRQYRHVTGIVWALVRLGVSFMFAGLAQTIGLLAIRVIIMQHIDSAALGNFSAAWMISTTYVGLVLQAVGADYLPRLAPVINDRVRASRMVNEQTEIVLIMAAPILIGVQAATPWLVYALYSSAFVGTIEVLRWQILGDVLKIASWPLGMILVATQRGKTFFVLEAFNITSFILITWFTIGGFGIVATGIAFSAAYILYAPVVYIVAFKIIGFKWSTRSFLTIVSLFSSVFIIMSIAVYSESIALVVGLSGFVASLIYAFKRLSQLNAIPASIIKILEKFTYKFVKRKC